MKAAGPPRAARPVLWLAVATASLSLTGCGGDGEVANQQVQEAYRKGEDRLLRQEAEVLNAGTVDSQDRVAGEEIGGNAADPVADGSWPANAAADAGGPDGGNKTEQSDTGDTPMVNTEAD